MKFFGLNVIYGIQMSSVPRKGLILGYLSSYSWSTCARIFKWNSDAYLPLMFVENGCLNMRDILFCFDAQK